MCDKTVTELLDPFIVNSGHDITNDYFLYFRILQSTQMWFATGPEKNNVEFTLPVCSSAHFCDKVCLPLSQSLSLSVKLLEAANIVE